MEEQVIKKIEIGSETVEIEKMFGSIIFASLRITPNLEHGWCIERQIVKNGKWIQWCEIPAQIEEEFLD